MEQELRNLLNPLFHLKWEPAAFLHVVNVGVALISAFVVGGVSTHTEAVITTTATAVAGLITFCLTRPINVSAFAGVATSCFVAAAGFGLKLTPQQLAMLVAAMSGIMGFLLRANVTPAARVAPTHSVA